ncbi:multidrug effflux MFS transporter [Formosa algae]|uniref:DHA1 family bicyclomycin/chloramphenicol resistance-like MFS transporter n=1 Tax=Formosa algae TaxID=225843 RepID=A0A9X0YNB6_9FLAO|nr:multidrug effflux MFS transporter [Formosa algae]MBP1841078.1 DHA1 family bicyclomycin/chloramphenicol resistance-like MFS transporter [Formosa algae]MDQ0336502.1 DHA1 family bicyclomycin/chloramphenicol resistance-like MFS transporter [Formosa algae]OEI81460.1 MFS transporter [Formosa algae]
MQKDKKKNHFEFIALMASLMSIVALSIDALLPAIPDIGKTIGNQDSTDLQQLITMIFLGFGIGQLILGPLSDSFGRKPIMYIGFSIFIMASFVCIFSTSLEWMLVGRILQGIGLSAPRTICISIIRDSHRGNYMARMMSFVTAFFILVPVIAPALGQFILNHFNWEYIFFTQLFFAVVVTIWFWKRQPETLHPEYKIPFNKHVFINGFSELIRYKEALVFTVLSGFITGSFMVYLSSAQHVFIDQYKIGDNFPYVFAGLAISIGVSTLLNGTLVVRFGMRRLALTSLAAFSVISSTYVALFWNTSNPSIFILVLFLGAQFFTLGFLFGNLRAIAMEPIGHIAGIGAALTGFISTIVAIPIATFIGGFMTDSALPLFMGFATCGTLALLIFLFMKRHRLYRKFNLKWS